jgi:hypothetical protein
MALATGSSRLTFTEKNGVEWHMPRPLERDQFASSGEMAPVSDEFGDFNGRHILNLL